MDADVSECCIAVDDEEGEEPSLADEDDAVGGARCELAMIKCCLLFVCKVRWRVRVDKDARRMRRGAARGLWTLGPLQSTEVGQICHALPPHRVLPSQSLDASTPAHPVMEQHFATHGLACSRDGSDGSNIRSDHLSLISGCQSRNTA